MWKEITAAEMDWNAFPRRKGNWFLVTAGEGAAANPLLGTYGGFLSLWGRDCAAVFLRESRWTKHLMDASETFSLAVLPEAYRDAVRYCGSHSGRDGDKWTAAGLTPVREAGVPFPAEASLAVLCRKVCACPIETAMLAPDIARDFYTGRYEGDPHTMYVGEILKILRK